MACRGKHNDELLGDHIPSGILMHVVFQVEDHAWQGGTNHGCRTWSGGTNIGRGPSTA